MSEQLPPRARFRDGETVWKAAIYSPTPAVIECQVLHEDGLELISYTVNGRERCMNADGEVLFRDRSDALGEWHSESAQHARRDAEFDRPKPVQYPIWTGD